MSILLHDGSTEFTVLEAIVDGFTGASEARTVTHQLLGGGTAHTLRPADPMSGRLRTLAGTLSAASALHAALRAPAVWTFDDDDNPELGMSFVVVDQIELELDDETREQWWVEFGFARLDDEYES